MSSITTTPSIANTTATASTDTSTRNSDMAHTVGEYRSSVEAAFGGRVSENGPLKLDTPEHETPKYLMGRIFSHYPSTPEGLRQALPEIQKYYPEAKIVGSKGDKIDFGSATTKEGEKLGVVDVIQAAGEGGKSWQWCPVESKPGVGGVPSGWDGVFPGNGAGGSSDGPDMLGLELLLDRLKKRHEDGTDLDLISQPRTAGALSLTSRIPLRI